MSGIAPYRWVRVDDRLLHGQVALGWRHALDPAAFLILDDAVAADPFATSLFRAALPEGLAIAIMGLREFLDATGLGLAAPRTVVLIRGLAEARFLWEGGFQPAEINLGGIHHREGARRYLDYLFLTDADREAARWLMTRGAVLFAQDLPSSPRRALEDLIATGGSDP